MKSVWEKLDRKPIEDFARGYIEFLSSCKTERKVVQFAEDVLRRSGFVGIGEYDGSIPGKVYLKHKEKSIMALKINSKLTEGLNLVASHIDSPRIDLKPNPIVEDERITLAKTHYYGGIKKYQWLNIPLALIGVVVKEDGTKIEVDIGSSNEDPVLVISDLLPHLDRKDEKISEKFKAEKLNVILGTIPLEGEEKEAVKKNVLRIMKDRYKIDEEDFVSADIEIVPAFPAREVGIDGSMIGAYGHDDRICAYTSLIALIEADSNKNMGIILFDREEIGSEGNTGAKSRFYKSLLRRILKLQGEEDVEYSVDLVLEKTHIVSADVNVALDPNYKDVFDIPNTARLGYGIVLTKYTGSRGKVGASEASAELMAKVRRVLNEKGISWQIGTLGKVDVGGGGTVAKFLAQEGAEVVDIGPAVLGMHSPFEIVSKADLYESYRAYKALLENL